MTRPIRSLWLLSILTLVAIPVAWLSWPGETAPMQPETTDAGASRTASPAALPTAPEREADPPRAAKTAETPPDPSARIHGHVLDAATGRPLEDASIVCGESAAAARAGGPICRSRADGSFQVRCPVRERARWLHATHPAYLPWTLPIAPSSVGPDGVHGLVLRLHPRVHGARVAGAVRDPGGRGLPAATITFVHLPARADPGPTTRLEFGGPATIDAEGRFALADVPPGTYRLLVRCAGYCPHERTGLVLLEKSATDLGTLELQPTPVGRIRGHLTADALPLASTDLVLRLPAGDTRRATSGPDGGFQFDDVPAGEHFLTVQLRTLRYMAGVRVTAAATTRHDVRLLSGDAFVGGTVSIGETPTGGIEVTCDPAPDSRRDQQTWITTTDAQGRFRFDDLPAGPVTLTVSVRVPYQTLEFPDIATQRLDHRLKLRPPLPPTRLHGRVRDAAGRGIAGAVLTTLQSPGLVSRARSRADGAFELQVQFERDMSFLLLCHAPGFAPSRRYLTPAMATGAADLDFTLHAQSQTGTVDGRIQDQHGAAIAGATVLLAAAEAGFRRRLTTDHAGRFLQRGVQPGPVRIHATARGCAAHHTTATLAPGASLTEDLTLRRDTRRTCAVFVELPDGSPAHGVQVDAWEIRGRWLARTITDRGLGRLTDLPDRPFELSLQLRGHPRQTIRHGIPGPTREPLRLRLRRGAGSVRGVARSPAGRPRAGVEIILAQRGSAGATIEAITYSDAQGRFRFDHLPGGDFLLSCYPGPKNLPVEVGTTPAEIAVTIR